MHTLHKKDVSFELASAAGKISLAVRLGRIFRILNSIPCEEVDFRSRHLCNTPVLVLSAVDDMMDYTCGLLEESKDIKQDLNPDIYPPKIIEKLKKLMNAKTDGQSEKYNAIKYLASTLLTESTVSMCRPLSNFGITVADRTAIGDFKLEYENDKYTQVVDPGKLDELISHFQKVASNVSYVDIASNIEEGGIGMLDSLANVLRLSKTAVYNHSTEMGARYDEKLNEEKKLVFDNLLLLSKTVNPAKEELKLSDTDIKIAAMLASYVFIENLYSTTNLVLPIEYSNDTKLEDYGYTGKFLVGPENNGENILMRLVVVQYITMVSNILGVGFNTMESDIDILVSDYKADEAYYLRSREKMLMKPEFDFSVLGEIVEILIDRAIITSNDKNHYTVDVRYKKDDGHVSTTELTHELYRKMLTEEEQKMAKVILNDRQSKTIKEETMTTKIRERAVKLMEELYTHELIRDVMEKCNCTEAEAKAKLANAIAEVVKVDIALETKECEEVTEAVAKEVFALLFKDDEAKGNSVSGVDNSNKGGKNKNKGQAMKTESIVKTVEDMRAEYFSEKEIAELMKTKNLSREEAVECLEFSYGVMLRVASAFDNPVIQEDITAIAKEAEKEVLPEITKARLSPRAECKKFFDDGFKLFEEGYKAGYDAVKGKAAEVSKEAKETAKKADEAMRKAFSTESTGKKWLKRGLLVAGLGLAVFGAYKLGSSGELDGIEVDYDEI